ncbi:MAG: hypothetical protein R2780_11785 [Crocinitomicaceae bacterium]
MSKIIRLIFIFSIFSICQVCYSQKVNFIEYHLKVNEAELAFHNSEFVTADSILKSVFDEFGAGFPDDFLFAANNAIKLNNSQLALNYIIQGFKYGLTIRNVRNNLIYKALKHEILTFRFLAKYRKYRKEYINQLNQDIRCQICDMVKEDQKYRSSRYDKKPWSEVQPLMKEVDSLNFIRMLEICRLYGFPGSNLVGDDGGFGCVDVPILLRHMDSVRLKQLEPYIMTSIQNGFFEPFAYVSALDYTSMFKTTIESRDEYGNRILIIQQKYGTITGFDENQLFIYPVENIEIIDSLRRFYGLESIEDYALKKGCPAPIQGIYKRIF